MTSAAMPASGTRLPGIRTASSVTVNPTRLLFTRYEVTEKSKWSIRAVRRIGKVTIARGTAKVVDKKTNAKLKVTFFWLFYGDYWVIG